MSGSHGTLCIDSFYPETEWKITEIQQYKDQILKSSTGNFLSWV